MVEVARGRDLDALAIGASVRNTPRVGWCPRVRPSVARRNPGVREESPILTCVVSTRIRGAAPAPTAGDDECEHTDATEHQSPTRSTRRHCVPPGCGAKLHRTAWARERFPTRVGSGFPGADSVPVLRARRFRGEVPWRALEDAAFVVQGGRT